MNLVEFLEARITEDEAAAHPQTVIISGGYPAPEVVNCIGASGRGCDVRWGYASNPPGLSGWWKDERVQQTITEHELTHVTPAQRRALAECAAKRAIIARYHGAVAAQSDTWRSRNDINTQEACARFSMTVMGDLAAVYSDHPDYREDWSSAT